MKQIEVGNQGDWSLSHTVPAQCNLSIPPSITTFFSQKFVKFEKTIYLCGVK